MIERIITGDLSVNTYLYNYSENKIAVIDPGSESRRIIESIKQMNFTPTCIILTHGHFDHIGAVKEIKDNYNIPVYVHAEDAKYLGEKGYNVHKEMLESMGMIGDYYMNIYYTETPEADYKVKNSDTIGETGLMVLHTPGHSQGSICLYSKNNSLVFTGDTLFKMGAGRTDFPGGDFKTLQTSLENLLQLPQQTKIYPGHGPDSTIGQERDVMQLY